MSSSPNAAATRAWGSRVIRGNTSNVTTAPLNGQLEPAGPGDAASVDPRLRDRSMEEGRRVGFQQGYEDGMREAATQLASLQGAIVDLQRAAAEFRAREIDLLAAAEDEIIDAVFSLAEVVLQRELASNNEAGREAIKRALALAPNGNEAVAFLNPADADQIPTPEIETEGRLIRIVPNPTVQQGGCILEIGPTRIDSQIHTAISRMREDAQ